MTPEGEGTAVVYWDASALVSAVLRDDHTDDASRWSGTEGIHLVSTLAHAEATATFGRLGREGYVSAEVLETALASVDQEPWKLLRRSPTRSAMSSLVRRHALKGADLWHLALAKTLVGTFPTLLVLTYDERLRRAAEGEDLAAP